MPSASPLVIRNTLIALACFGAIGGGIAYFVRKPQPPITVAVLNTPTPAAKPLVVATPTPTETFKGYYAPKVLVSPMRDDVQYTPTGRGDIEAKAGNYTDATGKKSFRNGLDLKAKLNDRVYNLLDGVVTRVGWRDDELGVTVELYHPYPNVRTLVCHLNAYSVLPGQKVERGRVIGYAGSTGNTKSVQTRYIVINDQDEYIEPMQFIRKVPDYVKALHKAQRAKKTKAKAPMH